MDCVPSYSYSKVVIVTLGEKSKCYLVLIMTFFVPRALRMLRIPVMSAL